LVEGSVVAGSAEEVPANSEMALTEVNPEKYLLIHTIDTLTRAYQAFMFNKEEQNAKQVAEKIGELVKKIQ
jgi:hypothetical protein